MRLRRLLEGREALGGVQVPDGCWRPPVRARRHRQIHVAHGPARIGTEAVHGILQGLRTAGGLVGGPRDVLDQLQEGGALLDALFEGGRELRAAPASACLRSVISSMASRISFVSVAALTTLAGIEPHRLPPDGGEVVLHLKVLEALCCGSTSASSRRSSGMSHWPMPNA